MGELDAQTVLERLQRAMDDLELTEKHLTASDPYANLTPGGGKLDGRFGKKCWKRSLIG